MTQFNFTTNIEKRMPDTGKVFCVDRMTSDYADQHPFDVDGFIESVYQEFAGTEFEESRETLRCIWTAVLSVTSPCGDATLYPNNNGAKRAAAMKVWHKAGDYWRRGLRQGDTLPDMVPMTKITRLDDGAWIALFPKDEHLLTTTNSTDETDNIEPVRNQSVPRQLDLFAFNQPQAENEHLTAPVRSQQTQPVTATVPVGFPTGDNHAWLKIAGCLAAASVALLLIWQTGLMIPLGLIGLSVSGLLK